MTLRAIVYRIFPVIGTVILTAAALAQPQPKTGLTIRQALGIIAATQSLDGHMVLAKQDGRDVAIMQPWEFGSGALRLRIMRNLSALKPNVAAAADIRAKFAASAAGLKPESPEYADLAAAAERALDAPALGAEQVRRLKVSELRLDRNEIPISVLAALEPILDDDTR